MRNKFAGICKDCGKRVEAGAGHFQRVPGGWVVRHVECVAAGRAAKAAETVGPSLHRGR